MRTGLLLPTPVVVAVAFAVLAAAPGVQAAGRAASRAAPVAQLQGPEDELEVLRRTLAQPGGGEARREREAAVDALLRRREPAAHELLAAVIRRGEDADQTASYVLRSLDRTVAQPAATVFADPRLREIALRTYLAAIVRLFATDPPLLDEAASAPLLPLARRILARLSFLDRRDRFAELVASGDTAAARAALRAAGASRDVALVEWIAGHLEKPELAAASRAALAALTFAETPFPDRAAFDAWHATHRDLDYLELAERAARRGDAAAARLRAEAEDRYVAQTAKLIAALAQAESPDWKAISAELAGAPSEVGARAYLAVLRDALADRIDRGARLAGIVQDRQAFAREIRLRLEALVDRPASYAVHLETLAYLAVREDAAQRRAVEERLVASLGMEDPGVRRAACRGLRRYPSVANRQAVVTAAEAAMFGGDGDTLREALLCLSAPMWTAPAPEDPDRESWLLLLRQVLTSADLDMRAKERALDIAIQRDATDALDGAAFELLVELVRDPAIDSSLRKQALPRLLVFTRDPAQAETYVRVALGVLNDPDAALRRAAAHQLTSLPEATHARRAEWFALIVEDVSRRLREETEAAVARELLDCLLSAADAPEVGAQVLRGLLEAARAVGARGGAEDAFRRDLVIEGLRILGVSRARDSAAWLAAAEALATLRARDALRAVLDRKNLNGASDVEDLPADQRDAAVAAAMRLVIAAAQLKPAEQKWSERPEEAERVRRAFDTLDQLGQTATKAADRALRITVLSGLGRPAEVVAAGNAALSDLETPLGTDERIAVLRAVISAQLELATLDAAEKRLIELDGLTSGAPVVAELWTRLAQRRLSGGQPAQAVEIMTRIVGRTSPDEAAWRGRFLLQAEARIDADPDANRAAVLRDLTAEEPRFVGDQVPPELATRYAGLVRRARGQG